MPNLVETIIFCTIALCTVIALAGWRSRGLLIDRLANSGSHSLFFRTLIHHPIWHHSLTDSRTSEIQSNLW
jgi:hypothetical protein